MVRLFPVFKNKLWNPSELPRVVCHQDQPACQCLATRSGVLVRALRNTGKTAFTLYVGQTVVSLLLFNVVLRPMWGTWSRLPLLVYVLLFAVVQVVFAHWWQKHRGIGPLEGMWRKLATV